MHLGASYSRLAGNKSRILGTQERPCFGELELGGNGKILDLAAKLFLILQEQIQNKALFTSYQKPKIFQDSPSHQIFRRMHGVLNIDENKN